MVAVAALLGGVLWAGVTNGHLAPFHKGMYCLNGPTNSQDLNSYAIVSPLYQLNFNDWWMHHSNGCDQYPPADGDFLDLPAGGSFTVEMGSNRAKTSLSYGGMYTSEWPDGSFYPENYNMPGCIISPNMHAQNESRAAGTAFAISYQSDIKQVNPQNLVVFSVRYNTPWKRIVSYDVPAAMPACPPGGCTCAWGWVPNGCGQPNMYQTPFKCRVTGASSVTPLASPKPPVWCEGNPDGCTKGAKQMIYWNQNQGNNIAVSGYDFAGDFKSPAYNSKCGFPDGAQNDIFSGPTSSPGHNTPAPGSPSNPGNSGSANPTPNNPASGGSSPSTPSPAATPAASTNAAPASSPPTTTGATNNGVSISVSTNTPPDTNSPPSCKRRRRRSLVSSNSDSALVKKSLLARGDSISFPAAHRRHHARQDAF